MEKQAIGLVDSVVKFGHGNAKLRMRAYSPRLHNRPSAATLAVLRASGVEWCDEPLNKTLAHYPIANKVFAMRHAESNASVDAICFLDSDKFVTAPIEASLLSGGVLAMRPVNRKGPGSTGQIDPNDQYWQLIAKYFSISYGQNLETVVSGESIRPYFNSGFVLFDARSGLAEAWYSVLSELLQASLLPGGNLRCMDQIALAVVSAKYSSGQVLLSSGVNFPLPFVDELRLNPRFIWPKDVLTLHYYKLGSSPQMARWIDLVGLPAAISHEVKLIASALTRHQLVQ